MRSTTVRSAVAAIAALSASLSALGTASIAVADSSLTTPAATSRPAAMADEVGASACRGTALRATGLTADQRLVRFDVDTPGSTTQGRPITGLIGDTKIVGIDYRVQDNLLYGVGDLGGIYTYPTSGAAIKVSQLTVALDGANFGVDFNPAADRLRVISDTGQNLRHDLNLDVTTVDVALTYPPVPPAPATPGVGVTGAAYTNNDLDPSTATTLFDLDTTLDQIVVQSPANGGQLAATGKLGGDAGADAGFDIYSIVVDGKAADVCGYAAVQFAGKYRFYEINLINGAARFVGNFNATTQVTDIAFPLNQL